MYGPLERFVLIILGIIGKQGGSTYVSMEKKMPNDELISYLKIICEANPSHQKAKLKLKTLNSTDFQNEKG